MNDSLTHISENELTAFRETGFMTTHMAMEAAMDRVQVEERGKVVSDDTLRMIGMVEKIEKAIDEFNVEVWLRWLYGAQRSKFSDAYFEANAANVNMLVGILAGRVMITLRWRDEESNKPREFVSMLGADKLHILREYTPKVVSGLCGFQGIGMNGDRATKLILEAARVTQDLANSFKPTNEVFFG